MKKAYIAIMVILVMGLAACSSEEIPKSKTETVAVIGTTDISTDNNSDRGKHGTGYIADSASRGGN